MATWSSGARLLLIDSLLFAIVIAWAIVSTPHLRFSGEMHGDEPKYIRYCEVWYQGGGFDISSKKPFAEEPLDARPAAFRIPWVVVRSLGEEAVALVADLRGFAADPGNFRWNRVSGANGFVNGKHGGLYQIYQPGLSYVLFPGYFVDRYLLSLVPGYQDEFPSDLPMTNGALLLVYGACAVALFRLLRHALESDLLAAIWAGLAIVALPAGAFAFQFYPELPGLLGGILATTYVMFNAREAHPRTAALAGGCAAFLAWLHPRFLLMSLVLVAAGAVRTKSNARLALIVSAGLVYMTVGLFDYRVTGSWSPTALWDTSRPHGGIVATSAPINLLGYTFHRTWGMIPHAPFLLAVVPGFVVLARRSWRDAALLSAIVLALSLPAAGHTLSAAGGTPGRLVVAVVPLLVWPAALFVRRFWHSTPMRAATVAAIVLSLETALAYNWSHTKAIGPLHSLGLAGWRLNIAFPTIRDDGWLSPANMAILLTLIVLVMAGALMAFRSPETPRPDRVRTQLRTSTAWAIVVVLLVTLSTASSAATGTWFYDGYLADRVTSHRAAAEALLASERCRICFTSRERAIDWTALQPNPARGPRLSMRAEGSSVFMDVTIDGDGPWTPFGRVRIDFGDETVTKWTAVVGSWRVSHTYQRQGEYAVRVWLQLPDGEVRAERQTIRVPPSTGG